MEASFEPLLGPFKCFDFAMGSSAMAQSTPLKPVLSGMSFLVGSWGGGGKVAETGGTTRGSSTITPEAIGSVLLRRDHADLFSADGKPSGGFDLIMMIYADNGNIHADYADGDHIIHYTSATIVPGRSVTFTTGASPTSPAFRLTYEKTDSATLAIRFELAPPGQAECHPIATGTLHKNGD